MAVCVLVLEPFAGGIVWENQGGLGPASVTSMVPEYQWVLSVFMLENSQPKVSAGRRRKSAVVKVNTRWCPSPVSF